MDQITKRQLRRALGVEVDSAVAEFFGISASAVSQWGDDEPLPEKRQLQLALHHPDLVRLALAEAQAGDLDRTRAADGAAADTSTEQKVA